MPVKNNNAVVMLVTLALAISCVLTPSSSLTIKDFLQDSIKGTWNSATPNSATLFFCSKQPQVIMRDLAGLGLAVKLAQPLNWMDALNTVKTASPTGLHTLIVDWQCPRTEELLREASKLAVRRSPYRWIALNVTENEQAEESCQDLAAKVAANGTAFAEAKADDADIVLVCRGPSSFVLVDFWGSILPTVLGKWSPDVENRFLGDRRPPAARRLAAGFNGYLFRTAFVITHNDTYAHLTDGQQKQYDYMTKFNYEVCHALVTMLNGTIRVSYTNEWGYKNNGTWTGQIGMQIKGEAEIGGTPLILVHDRMPYVTFLNYQTPAEGIFVFKEPPLSYIYNLFTRPFPRSLWLCAVGMVSLGALLLYGTLRIEGMIGVKEHVDGPQMAEGRKRRLDASWSDVILLSVGAVCQQGSPTEARGVPGRIVTLSLFLGILFLYTSYSASIVVLLQGTTSNIQHYKDFLDSRIHLGAENTPYNTYFMKVANDTYRRRVYLEKLVNHGRRNPFMVLEEGVEKMRTSYFAFFSLRYNLYQIIADTFQEHEKCGLREVEKFGIVSNPHLTVSKWSTHTEVIKIGLRKIQERGIRDRQLKKFLPAKPVCVNQGGNFQSVSLIDCYPAFMVLAGGLAISLVLFLMENLVYSKIRRLFNRKTL